MDADPHTRLVDNLAVAEVGAAARAVPEVLGTGLGTHVFEVAQHAVAARLAAEQRPLHGELQLLDGVWPGGDDLVEDVGLGLGLHQRKSVQPGRPFPVKAQSPAPAEGCRCHRRS